MAWSADVEEAIAAAARRSGLDPALLRSFARIESGGDPSNRTGSYRGLFQLSPQEFERHGGQGDILNPYTNAQAAANKLQAEAADFARRYGRQPTAGELYLQHQQGLGGAAAHWANPDAPAWQNMASTGEGRSKGEAWARQAIWGNIPDDQKRRFGSVDNVTSRDFTALWDAKVAGQPSDQPVAAPTQAADGQKPSPAQDMARAEVPLPGPSDRPQPQGDPIAKAVQLATAFGQPPQAQAPQAPLRAPVTNMAALQTAVNPYEPPAAKPEQAPLSNPIEGPLTLATGGGVPDDDGLDTGGNTPEAPGALLGQQQQLVDGGRDAQMFPKGTEELPVPDGMQRTETERGAYHFNPARVTAKDVSRASKTGRENEILGLGPLSKADVTQVARQRGENVLAVVERDADGNEIKAAAATPSTAHLQALEIARGMAPGHTLGIESIEDVIAGRNRAAMAHHALRMANGGSVDRPYMTDPPLPPHLRHLQPQQKPLLGYQLPKGFEGFGDDRDLLRRRFLFQPDASGAVDLAPGTNDGGVLGPFPPDDRMREIDPGAVAPLPEGFKLRR